MKTLKRIVAVLLSVLMLLSVFAVTAISASADTSTTAYFVNSYGWSDVKVHVWGGSNNTSWPGVAATVVDAENGVYSYDLTDSTFVVFNNGKTSGGSQTANLNAADAVGKYYEPKTATFYDTLEEALAAKSANTFDYCVVGSAGLCGVEWASTPTVATAMTKGDDGIYSITFENIAAGEYIFKIMDKDCGYHPSGMNNNSTVKVNNDGSTVIVTFNEADDYGVAKVVGQEEEETTESSEPTTDSSESATVETDSSAQEESSVTQSKSYCIIGNINGVDVGDGDHHLDVINVITPEHPLTLEITQDSWVYVKTTDCKTWYMFNSYCQETTGTLYNTETGSSEKMYVPAGSITFTIVKNENDTLTLSYTDGEVQPSTDPSEDTSEDTTPSTEPSSSEEPSTDPSTDPSSEEPSTDPSASETEPTVETKPAIYDVEVDVKAEEAESVKINFALQTAEKCVNGEGFLTYDSSALKLESFEFSNVNGSVYNTDLYNEIRFTFTDPQNLSDFTTSKDFVVVTFTVLKDAKSTVTLNLIELNAVSETDIPLVTDGNIVGEYTMAANTTVTAPQLPTEEPSTAPSESVPATPVLTLDSKVKPGKTTTAKVENATKVTYSTSNKKIATIDENGVVTGLKKGTVTITAVADGVTLTKKVQVTADPVVKNGNKELKNKSVIKVKNGKKLTLKIVGKAAKIANKVTLKSAKVGKITSKATASKVIFKAKKKGNSKLVIKINGVKKYTFTVKVK